MRGGIFANGRAGPLLAAAIGAVFIAAGAGAQETASYKYDALGRLIQSTVSGGASNGQSTSVGYDFAGNRCTYVVTGVGGAPPLPPPTPCPTAPPPPANNPPVANPNNGAQQVCTTAYYAVLANDTDPDGDYPLSLVSVAGNGGGTFTISNGTIEFISAGSVGTKTATYTVRDSRGATATGQLAVNVSGGDLRMTRGWTTRLFLALGAIAAAGTAARAQDVPTALSPPQVTSERNGVNLVDGRIVMDLPTLSVPAAPNLRFDRLQNAAPYISAIIIDPRPDYEHRTYAVHTGAGTSDSFECFTARQCVNLSGSSSTFDWRSGTYQQAGSGIIWKFGTLLNTSSTREFRYASKVIYPNGEEIHYFYDPRGGLRPNNITSTLGYYITLSYHGDDIAADPTAWASVKEATLYAAGATPTVLGRLTYSGATITDHGSRPSPDPAGRTYVCTGCSNGLGYETEVSAGSSQLPGEGTSLQVSAVTDFPQQTGHLPIASVVRDGVQWTYSYSGPVLQSQSLGWTYTGMTVNGPDKYRQSYTFGTRGRQNAQYNQLASVTEYLDIGRDIRRTTSYTWNGSHLDSVVYPEGNRVDLTYDTLGNLTRLATTPKGGGSPIQQTATYPALTCLEGEFPVLCWRPTSSADALQRVTTYSYNDNGQLTEQVEPADQNGVSRRTSTTYDAIVNADTTTISRRKEVRVCSNTGVTCGVNSPIRTIYDYLAPNLPANTLLPSATRQTDMTESVTLTTRYAYDDAGRLLMTDGPLPGSDDATYLRYDVYGRKTWEIGAAAPSGVRVAARYTYRDSDDRPTRIERGTVPNATDAVLTLTPVNQTDIAYDARRNARRETVYSGSTTYSVIDRRHDLRGRLECEARRMNPAIFPVNGAGGSVPEDACELGQQGAGAADLGPDRITHNAYDDAGQLLQVQRAYRTPLQQNYATYSYSPNGRQTSVTDANGNRAEMTWDGFDRQRRWIFPSATTPGTANQADYEEYGYDANGNRISLRRRDTSVLGFQYDNLNRMIAKIVPERSGLSATHTRDVYYDYDLRNQQISARFDGLVGEGISNSYDWAGRLTETTLYLDGVARTLSYQYDEGGRRTRITHPVAPGESTPPYFTYTYDARSRLTLVRENGSGWLNGFSFDDAKLGAVNVQTYETGSAGLTLYGQDGIRRLTSALQLLPGDLRDVSFSFGYNPASQIIQRTRNNDAYAWPGARNVSRAYTANGLNQYRTSASTADSGSSGGTLGYDANGNLASGSWTSAAGSGSTTFVYDIENRLVQATGDRNAALRYDPLGRLYELTGATGTTRFLYDGDALVAEYDGAGALTARYVHGANAAGDDPLVQYVGGVRRFLISDHQGSIVALTAASGTPSVNSYDEWGIPATNAQGAPLNTGRFQYTGQAWIPELGLYHYKARFYSPTLGRFLQVDPVGYDDQVNLYAYVGNDPVNGTDPTGLTMDNCGSRLGISASCSGGTLLGLTGDWRATSTQRPRSFAGQEEPLGGAASPSSLPDPPSNLPGGPYEPKPDVQGNRPGSFQGPRQASGPRFQAQWVPPQSQGGPPGSSGYWKVQAPNSGRWQHFDRGGRSITAQQAHPNPPQQQSLPARAIMSIVGVLLYAVGIFGAAPAN